jgi:molybdenum cofactor cytidylyltransferase
MGGTESGIVGLLLAAGSSQRFGRDKLEYPMPDGRPMAVAAAAGLLAVCERTIAIVRPADERLATLLAETGCEIVRARHAELGMGASLAAGVGASAEAEAWIVALADMPYIDSRSHQAVRSRLRAGASLAATQYQGRRGHPVGFSKAWFPQLASLTGDQGGKSILESHPDQLALCPVDDRGVLLDIDTPDDLEKTD